MKLFKKNKNKDEKKTSKKKAAAEEAPKKKKAIDKPSKKGTSREVIETALSKKKSKGKDKGEKPSKSDKKSKGGKGGGGKSHNPKAIAETTPAVEKLIKRALAAEAGIEEAKEAFQTALSNLGDGLPEGMRSFKHPKLGPYSVMQRGDVLFWRPKPCA